ncbi:MULTISPECIES: DegT/DnrJ/EryC1/StrS family aminotransferase [Olivibacter]|uniref:DegT/DnrJ/EryC1/StrS family aminotransferase n=1 Tax=Olivibacter jilunii TaxID=985016 RepID=A0ABW6BA44_9SPHI|nr:DegT/DnrJ/EryC1/StrS family aminotransferase [Olivibacter sp. UJ_SKK_5.1]MDX3912650.1 DegT/DnrJ/EryC1/StrS family aminotransferase [Pseudosphingobacterium sp.]
MDFIPLASPDIQAADIHLVNEVLKSGMLVQGRYVEKLEHSFSEVVQVPESIAVSNGTASLHLPLRLLGIGPGDEVIVPAFSYVATANVVELVGAKPVFVDIDLGTYNIDVSKIREAITVKTKAIIPVHEFGLACDIEAVMQLAIEYDLYVIEDAACALGATQHGRQVGSFGDFGSFSLHPRKSITSGEGGVVTTHNSLYAQRVRRLRNHGIDMVEGKMVFEEAGFNYRLTDIQGALAYSQLSRLSAILEKKQRLAEIYLNGIKNRSFALPIVPSDRNHTWQTFHILIDDGRKQADVLNYLREHNIGANYGAQCIPAQKYYINKYDMDYKLLYPNAYAAFTQGIALPLYEKLNDDTIQYIAKIINSL